MGYNKKAQKWATAVGLPGDPCFWTVGDAAPLKEFFAKLLSSELLKTASDITVSDPIPFEKLLSLAQQQLGIHTALVASDLNGCDENIKIGLFTTVLFLRSALADYKPGWVTVNFVVTLTYTADVIAQIDTPDFSVAGGSYSNKPICLKCKKEVLYIERIVVADRIWHRSCMHCRLCGKRLFLGQFRLTENCQLECFEHYLNESLCGNALQSFEHLKPVKAPPPRPPPPRKSQSTVESEEKPASEHLTTPTIRIEEEQLAPANTPAVKQEEEASANESATDETKVLYPEELNPFGDEPEPELSDNNISSLNPFGDSSSDTESEDGEPASLAPMPMPRKSISPSRMDTEDATPTDSAPQAALKTEQVERVAKANDSLSSGIEDVRQSKTPEPSDVNYPKLRDLLSDDVDVFNFYLPSSLVLCSKRQLDLSDYDRPKLLHELGKVMHTLDFVEHSAKEAERSLRKDLRKEDFKWEKNPIVDIFGQAMAQKHDNLLKGSMLVHAYMNKLLNSAIERIDHGVSSESHAELRAQLLRISVKMSLDEQATSLPIAMEEPTPKSKDSAKRKTFVKRFKKVF